MHIETMGEEKELVMTGGEEPKGIGVSYAAFYNFAAILFAITMNKMG